MTIAAFDLDGTLLRGNISFAFCHFLRQQRYLSQLDLLYCMACYGRHLYFRLPLDELHHLVFKRLFAGRKVAELSPLVSTFLINKLNQMWYHPALVRLHALQQEGIQVAIFSNSPIFLVKPVADRLGIHQVFATEYHIDQQGRLDKIHSFVDGEQKARLLESLSLKPEFDFETLENRTQAIKSIVFTDSHHDLPFLEAAHIPVVVKPTKPLKKIARARGWEMIL